MNLLDELGVFFKFDPPLNETTHRQWEKALHGFTDVEVGRAGTLAVQNHKYKNAPLPAAIIEWLRAERDSNRGTISTGLDESKWIFGKDEKRRDLSWHPDMRDPEGKAYPQLTCEQIVRAHPKLTPGGKSAAMAAVRQFMEKNEN